MKFSIIAAASALIGCVTAADQAVVINSCEKSIFVQSFPYDGGEPGALTTVKPGKEFSETLRSKGSVHEFSTEFGNPFAANHNILSPGEGCEEFDCKADDAECYSTPKHKKVYGCPQPVNLTAHICVK
ncbi:hypothetical protein ACO1O0_005533 [Amphichorda felina]